MMALTWSPDADVFEREELFVVRMDLPGVSEHDLRVVVAEDELTITGERPCDGHEGEDSWQNEERPYGRFFRRVPLPDGAWSTHAQTRLANGVLEITVPVLPEPS